MKWFVLFLFTVTLMIVGLGDFMSNETNMFSELSLVIGLIGSITLLGKGVSLVLVRSRR